MPETDSQTSGDHIEVRDITNGKAIAIGRGATAVYQGLTVEEVATLVVELKNKEQPTVWNGRIPYLGLNAYQIDDARYFFGRESLVEELLQRVQQANFITIAGPSGSGKSSVARAGLFHALRQGTKIENSDRWLLATMQPKGNPIEQLAQAIERLTKTPGTGDHLRQKSQENPLALHQQAEALLSEDPNQRFVLLVDQFEELFTQTKDATMRQTFINLLTEAAQAEDSRCRILISLRSDFVSNCASHEHLRELISQQFQLVGAMAPRDLAKAITLPALEVGAEIDPKLVSQIIADMKGSPDALPLMSFALRDLFEVEKSKKGEPMDLTLPEYVQRGGLEKALEEHANKVFNNFTDAQKEIAKNIFSKLIEVGQGRVDTRRTATFAEFIPIGGNAKVVDEVLHQLSAENVRLITTSNLVESEAAEKIDQEKSVTITHEKLIDSWPWLRKLIDENRELIALQNQIGQDAQMWHENKRSNNFLLPPGRFLQIQERLEQQEIVLGKLSDEFITANLKYKQRQRLQRWISVGFVGAILIFITFLQINNLKERASEDSRQAEYEEQSLAFTTRLAELKLTSETSEAAQATAIELAQNSQIFAATLEAEKFFAEQTRDILFLTVHSNAQPTANSGETLSPTPNLNATATTQAQELAELRAAATAAGNNTNIESPTNLQDNAVILDVPYRSQWDNDAKFNNSDQGPTCLAMLLNASGIEISPDEIYEFLPDKTPNDFTYIYELVDVANTFNVEIASTQYDTQQMAISNLQANINLGKPMIVLVKYEPWIEITGNVYEWGHFVLVVGYSQSSIYIHDPLFGLWATRNKGAYFEMPIELFLDGWGGFTSNENPNWTALVPDEPVASQLTQ